MKVLSIETDALLASNLEAMLARAGHEVFTVSTGQEGIERAEGERWDIILPHLHLPDISGTALIWTLREEARVETPIIVLGNTSYHDAICLLDEGADDYVACPYHGRELLVRMKAVHRRARCEDPVIITAGALTLNRRSAEVRLDGVEILLTSREYRILERLAMSKNEIISVEDLAKASEYTGDKMNQINVMLYRLRCKLDPFSRGTFELKTFRGEGYSLCEP